MDTKQAQELIQKYLDGKCTAEERAIFESWYNRSIQDSPDPIGKPNYKALQNRLASALPAGGKSKTVRLWPRIVIAAAAVAAITLGTWLYPPAVILNLFQDPNAIATNNDIAPGSVGATLTLANGKTIKLSSATNGELAKEAGVRIKKTADGQLIYEIASSQNAPRNDGAGETTNTLTTAKGETYQIILPDGTAVWLNADSKITFPSSFAGAKQRKISLKGEAYFQVAKDKTHPFIVESAGQQVEVLGTHFNITSYADEGSTKTTLLEGSVKVSSSRGKRSDTEPSSAQAIGSPVHANSRRSSSVPRNEGEAIILHPNQQSILKGAALKIIQVDPASVIAWKNGKFRFENANLEEVMRQVSRWYDVDIEYPNGIPDERFSGGINRNASISEVLEILKFTKVNFRIEGKNIIVEK